MRKIVQQSSSQNEVGEIEHNIDQEKDVRPVKRVRREVYGDFDVEERSRLKFFKGIERLEKLALISEKARDIPIGKSPSNSFRVFRGQVLDPILRCLHHHCQDSPDEFIRRWGENFRISKFSSRCCTGKGDNCK